MPAKIRTPELEKAVIEAYQSGASLAETASRFGVSSSTVANWLSFAGVERRGLPDANVLRRANPLRVISPDRLHELYWGDDLPSLRCLANQLSETLGCELHPSSVHRLLIEHGIKTRSRGEQLGIDIRKGRVQANLRRFEDLPLEVQNRLRAGHAARATVRIRTAQEKRKYSLTRRKKENRPCGWCGKRVSRNPSQFRPSWYCDHACAAKGVGWKRRLNGPDAPRPLIVEALRKLIAPLEPTQARCEKYAAQVGARAAEIEAVLDTAAGVF